MSNPKKKTCPRCESDFECQVGSVAKCKCSSVFLSASERDYLALHYEEVLTTLKIDAYVQASALSIQI